MKRRIVIIWLTLATIAALLVASFAVQFATPSSQAQSTPPPLSSPPVPGVKSGTERTGHGKLKPQRISRSAFRKTPPDQPPREEEEDFINLDPPVDPNVRPEDIRPTNPPTEVNVKPTAPANPPDQPPPLAPNDVALFRNTPLASAPVVVGATLNRLIPIEPSAAVNGRVAFYTTNSYAAVSGDRGQSFTYINPFDYFPADGTNDPIDGGFGGDQYVYHARGMTFWLLQYNASNTTNNRQRLLVALSQQDVLNGNWRVYDFTPAAFGFTTPNAGASGFWLDFPDMAVSDGFLYLSTNVFNRVLPTSGNGCMACPLSSLTCPATCVDNARNPTCRSSCGSAISAVVTRIALSELALGGFVNFAYFTDTPRAGFRLAQGAHGTMYWGAHLSTSQMRIWRWADSSPTFNGFDDVSHAAYNVPATPCTAPNVPAGCGMIATSPDGNNFAGTADSRILGAYVAGGVIGFMWNAGQGGGFTFPHVQWLRFNESNRALLTQRQIFNNSHAFLYPSVHPNGRGHLGGTMAWGGGTFFPNALAWIADDINQAQAVPFDNLTFAQGNAAPNYNRWGDYFSTRMAIPYGNTWVGTGFVLNGANGVTRDPHFVLFGRERDTPPATNTIYVDRLNTSGFEDGTLTSPYNTINEGHFAAQPGDTLFIFGGNYNENVRFTTPITVRQTNGTVRIAP